MSLKVHNVSKRFGKLQAVRNVTLELHPGEGYAIVGSNGAGKTTLIKSLLGFYRHEGSVTFSGQTMIEAMASQQVGYLPEKLAFSALTTPLDYLELQAVSRGIRFSSISNRTREIADRLGLVPWLKTPLHRFSKGMTRKLAFLQSVMHQPQLIILDEPTDGLDPVARRIVLSMIRDMINAGATVLMTSHLLSDIERVAHRVGIMLEGQVAAETSLKELRGSDKVSVALDGHDSSSRELVLRQGNDFDLGGTSWTVKEISIERISLEEWYLNVLQDQAKEGMPL